VPGQGPHLFRSGARDRLGGLWRVVGKLLAQRLEDGPHLDLTVECLDLVATFERGLGSVEGEASLAGLAELARGSVVKVEDVLGATLLQVGLTHETLRIGADE
jgi:hypothetical protein